jgi:omega-6 fatty acid desaturase (delta-12 desaturase)
MTHHSEASNARMSALLTRARELDGIRIADAIPKQCYERNLARGLLGFFASYALWGAGLYLVSIAPHWTLWLPAWLLAGLGGWGLHCIAHDCGHSSFSGSRTANSVIGQIALLPLFYPFHGWRHVHNLHHSHTNSLELDTDWRPVDRAVYARMGLIERAIYRGTRSFFFWLGTAHYQLVSGFRPSYFPSSKARAEVRRSIAIVAFFSVAVVVTVLQLGGPLALLKYVLGPWLGIHAWFSTVTLMHHTAEDLPFLPAVHWSKNASKILLTTDFRYSRLLEFLTHYITVHTAHHIAPKIPYYNLPAAQAAIKHSYPGVVREKKFRFGELYRVIRHCHLFEPATGFYRGFSDRDAAPARLVDVDARS